MKYRECPKGCLMSDYDSRALVRLRINDRCMKVAMVLSEVTMHRGSQIQMRAGPDVDMQLQRDNVGRG